MDIRRPVCRSLSVAERLIMGSEEDAALLVLIHQHLKVSGYREAAQLLEEHLTQVEMPVESLNLHNIYTGWMK
ncbi:hypothetical protein CHARACLAT_008535 [Characodon lateralis]|uniref:LisH domain-containing protein n=1 Tax=Characodon lateralis TaxID=208331 RepID=A0ABU7DPW5_9TELE|nr:hypothetical protein [Characodon lateralis]